MENNLEKKFEINDKIKFSFEGDWFIGTIVGGVVIDGRFDKYSVEIPIPRGKDGYNKVVVITEKDIIEKV